MKRAQCSETVKSRVPSIWFVWKIWDFLVARGQKLGARVHRALLEHTHDFTLWVVFSLSTPRFKLEKLNNPVHLFWTLYRQAPSQHSKHRTIHIDHMQIVLAFCILKVRLLKYGYLFKKVEWFWWRMTTFWKLCNQCQ